MSEYSPRSSFFSDSQSTAAWFGGVLEAGATASIGVAQYFDHRSGVLRTKTQPYIEIHSHDQSLLRRLLEVYGGHTKQRFWNKGGYTAAEIVASTLPFTVARREHAIAMQNWLNAESLADKIAIAHDLRGKTWQQNTEPESYAELLKNPAFIAGIFDSRGYMYIRTANSKSDKAGHAQYVQVGSKNLGLLRALESSFGGRAKVTVPAGTAIDIRDTVVETQVDTHIWRALSSEAVNFLRFASPYLQTALPEGWDFQRSVVKQQNTQQLAESITGQVRNELERLKAGEADEISTDAMLAESFGVHKATVGRYLRRLLTPKEKKARVSAIITKVRSTIDHTAIQDAISYIHNEISAYQRGEVSRLSLREELASRFEISTRILDTRIIPHLDGNLNLVRLGVLRTQITQTRNRNYWQDKKVQN